MRLLAALTLAALAAPSAGAGPSNASAPSLRGAAAAAAVAASSSARALRRGSATDVQLKDILFETTSCFNDAWGRHAVTVSPAGEAVDCVQGNLGQLWGWRPFLGAYGSDKCGDCSAFLHTDGTTIAVRTPGSEGYMFVLRLINMDNSTLSMFVHEEDPAAPGPQQPALRDPDAGGVAAEGQAPMQLVVRDVAAVRRGDCSGAQLAEILEATRVCFGKMVVGGSDALGTALGAATGCVQAALGGRPVSAAAVLNCGDCEAYGPQTTVVAVETSHGGWVFGVEAA